MLRGQAPEGSVEPVDYKSEAVYCVLGLINHRCNVLVVVVSTKTPFLLKLLINPHWWKSRLRSLVVAVEYLALMCGWMYRCIGLV